MTDRRGALVDAVRRAAAGAGPVYIRGADSKRHILGRACAARPLETADHRGITAYQPDELVISARAGTPLAELQAALAERDQILPFEPPLFDGRATLGGTLACNLSGPARPWQGSIRDAVLGLELINGQGQLLRFGGRVMKNVAGFDVSRLQAGALGTLGLITEVNLKVLPRPERSLTLCYQLPAARALETMSLRAREPKPLSGACWLDGRLYLRLSGADSAVAHTARAWGGEASGGEVWEALREMRLPLFREERPLWRLSTSPAAPVDEGTLCIDWGGALRWQDSDQSPLAAGAHRLLFSGGERKGEVRGALDRVQQGLHRRLKAAMDPAGIFNPGRLYSWM